MKNKLRFYLGLSCFVLSWILPLFGFLVARLGLPLAIKATIIGLFTVGGPEILGILAVVCLGKENLLVIKDKILAVLRLIKPAAVVSRWRYRLRLVMFLLPIIPTYIMAYAPQWLPDHPLRQPGRGFSFPDQPVRLGRRFLGQAPGPVRLRRPGAIRATPDRKIMNTGRLGRSPRQAGTPYAPKARKPKNLKLDA